MLVTPSLVLLVLTVMLPTYLTQRSGKVSFPDSGAAPAPGPRTAESRLLADATGAFGLGSGSGSGLSSSSGAEGQPRLRNLERGGRDCPLCDPSVYSYCDEKLLHDACCCQPPQQLPPQCRDADCRFLHAKSCYEHRLITRCCCDVRSHPLTSHL